MSNRREKEDEGDGWDRKDNPILRDGGYEIGGQFYATLEEYHDTVEALRRSVSTLTPIRSTSTSKENKGGKEEIQGPERLLSTSSGTRAPFRLVSATATSSRPSATFFIRNYDKTDNKAECSRDDGRTRLAGRDQQAEVVKILPSTKKRNLPVVSSDSDSDSNNTPNNKAIGQIKKILLDTGDSDDDFKSSSFRSNNWNEKANDEKTSSLEREVIPRRTVTRKVIYSSDEEEEVEEDRERGDEPTLSKEPVVQLHKLSSEILKELDKTKFVVYNEQEADDADSKEALTPLENAIKELSRQNVNISNASPYGLRGETATNSEREKEEWRQGVIEKHDLIAGLFETDVQLEGGKVTKLVLGADPTLGERVIQVNEALIGNLFPHHFRGVKYMYLTCFGGLEQFSQGNESVCTAEYLIGPGRGLQIAAFAQAVLENESTGIKRILILCPPIKRKIWFDEIQKSFDYVDPEQRQLVHDLCDGEDIFQHIESLKMWTRCGGVGIMELDLFQQLDDYYTEDDDNMDIIQTALFNPGPDIVFFDYESIDKRNIPKNYTGLVKISTKRRIALPELYSHNPIQHISRVIFRDWLRAIGKGCHAQHYPTFKEFSKLVGYNVQRDVHWVKNKGFAVDRSNGHKSYLKSELPNAWRKNSSQVSKAYHQTPARKTIHLEAQLKHLSEITPTHVLYILVVSANGEPLTAENLADPNFKMYIYIGEWDARHSGGFITARTTHFCDPNSPIFILLSDPSNQCHQVVAVQCYNQFSAYTGETYLLEYADEWNQTHPDGARFIITKPEVQHLDEEGTLKNEARQKAKDGVWIFANLNEGMEPNPPPHAKFADLCNIPFGIEQTGIKKRVIPSVGNGSNFWKDGQTSLLNPNLVNSWRINTRQARKTIAATPQNPLPTYFFNPTGPNMNESKYVLYILVVSANGEPLTAENLADPNFKMYIYIGEWDAGRRGFITARFSHFSDPNSPIFILLSDPSNQCHQVVAVQCYNQFSAHNGEAYLLEYADEWNLTHPDGARFIITKPEVQHLDEEGTLKNEARQKAKDGMWIFEKVKDAKSIPSPLPKFADLCKIPFGIEQTCIKKRVIPSVGKRGNNWKD